MTKIGDGCFWNCHNLTSITIPDSVVDVGAYSFEDLVNLQSVVFGNSVARIDYGAFEGCSGLTSVTLPDSLTSIESFAFYLCSNLATVSFLGNPPSTGSTVPFYWQSPPTFPPTPAVAGFQFYARPGFGSTFLGLPVSQTLSPAPEIPSITSQPLSIVRTVGQEPSFFAVTVSGSAPFTYQWHKNGTALSQETNPTIQFGGVSLDDAGNYYVVISNPEGSVTSQTATLTVNRHSTPVPSDLTYAINGNEVTITDCNETASGHLEIPAIIAGTPVTKIGDGCFWNCHNLTSVTIPDSVLIIGFAAFEDLANLQNVVIGNSVTSIGWNAFEFCTSLTSITIPDSVTSIGQLAFVRCDSLTSVSIGNSVASIGVGAFKQCASLTCIVFRGGPPTSVSIDAFPTTNSGFMFKARAGFGATFVGQPVTQTLQVSPAVFYLGNNFTIDTDALNTTGLKVLHATTLGSSFTEVTGITKEGEGRVIIPSSTGLLSGGSGFFRVIYE